MAKIRTITTSNGETYSLDLSNVERWDYYGFGWTLNITFKEKDGSTKTQHKGPDAEKMYHEWFKDSDIPGDSWPSSFTNSEH